jgi:hypothetical protein
MHAINYTKPREQKQYVHNVARFFLVYHPRTPLTDPRLAA